MTTSQLTDELALALLQKTAGRPSKFSDIRKEIVFRIGKGEKNFTLPSQVSTLNPEETKKDQLNIKANTTRWNEEFQEMGIKFRCRFIPDDNVVLVVSQEMYEKVFPLGSK